MSQQQEHRPEPARPSVPAPGTDGPSSKSASNATRQARLAERTLGSFADDVGSAWQAWSAPLFEVEGAPNHTLRPGDHGAIVTATARFALLASADPWGAILGRFDSGEPCEVLAVQGSELIQIRIRVGEEMVEGWTLARFFDQQPSLASDPGQAHHHDFEYAPFPVEAVGEVALTDVAQGYLGDCSLMAVLGAVAHTRPDLLRASIVADPERGVYRVRLFEEREDGGYRGRWVEVDGHLPTRGDDRSDPVYAQDPGRALWPAIVEKALAQLHGSYEDLQETGSIGEALWRITGLDPGYTMLDDTTSDEELVQLLRVIEKRRMPLTLASELPAADATSYVLSESKRVFGNHTYVFEGVTDAGLIELYNPWGQDHPEPLTPAEVKRYFTAGLLVDPRQAEGLTEQ